MDTPNSTVTGESFEDLRYEKSSNHVAINDATRQALPKNAQQLLPGVSDLIQEVKQLKEKLAAIKEERDEFKEEVTFLKYQLAYRVQVENLQKRMSENKSEEKKLPPKKSKKHKSVRFSSSVSVEDGGEGNEEGEEGEASGGREDNNLGSNAEKEEYNQLKAEKEELEDVLYDFYHDSKMVGKNERVLVGDIDSDPSESVSSLVCRVLVNYEKLTDEHCLLEDEKSKLDEDKIQLSTSMAKLREQFHDAVDSNIEEIEDLNRQNGELSFEVKTLNQKENDLKGSFVQSREKNVSRLKSILELTKSSSMDKVSQRLRNDILQAENELKEARGLVPTPEQDKGNKVKRVQSLPSSFRQESTETKERGGLLRELKTCKDLQESQRKQIQKILEEKMDLETQLSELKRQIVFLKAERRANIKTKSRLVQTEDTGKENGVKSGNVDDTKEGGGFKLESLSRKCKELEKKLEAAKQEKSTVEDEKTCLLMSLDANIEKKDALEEQLNVLQAKLSEKAAEEKHVSSTTVASTQTDVTPRTKKAESSLSETDGSFKASYKKDISDVKVGIDKIRLQEQDKQIIILKRENEAVREKLKKAEDMSQTLQNCLKEITDEKYELLDSIEELNDEKAELEESRLKLENELSGTRREKFAADEVSDIRNKERKIGIDLEASKAKLTQLDLKVLEVLSLIGNEEVVGAKETNPKDGVDDMIGTLLSTVENLKSTVSAFKTTYEKTKGDSLRIKDELRVCSEQKNELQGKVEELQQKVKEMAMSLENNSKSQKSHVSNIGRLTNETSRLERELEKMRDTKVGFEKSLTEARKRERELERQLKDIREKLDRLQNAFDKVSRKCSETTSLLADRTKEAEQARRTNEKLTKELENLREDLEGTVEDRDELLELLDRIVCENGSGADEKQGLGLKVERIRERSRSEEALTGVDVVSGDPGKAKPVAEKYLASSEATVECSSVGNNELFSTVPTDEVNAQRNEKRMNELLEENQQLKEMFEKMINDHQKMEVALSSFSDVNAEIQQDLEESIEHTEKIRVQGSESDRGKDVVDHAADYRPTKADENEHAELRQLHDTMVGTNEALRVNLRRLQHEKARKEQLKNSWQEVSKKNANLESNVENLTNEKAKMAQELSTLKQKSKEFEKENEKVSKEKQDLENLLAEAKDRAKDLNVQLESLTEINQDLRETNKKVSEATKETEKKWSKLNDEFDEMEFENEALENVNKRLKRQLTEQAQQKTAIELELERSKDMSVSLSNEVAGHSEKSRKLQRSIETNEKELKILRETASKFSSMKDKVVGVGALKADIDALRKTVVEREKRVGELEQDVFRLKKEIESSQGFVKDVSQENDTLRDSLSEWEREARRIRYHVHQVSQDAEGRNESSERPNKEEEHSKAIEESDRSVKAFEAMQVEMDAINKHLKSLTNKNEELKSKVENLSEENNEMKDRNIQLLTRNDMVGKEMEKKVSEINKLKKDLKNVGANAQTNMESRDKVGKENSVLQRNCGKLERENGVLRNSLANTLDEERVLGERLKSLIDASRSKLQKSQRRGNEDLVSGSNDDGKNDWDAGSEVGELTTTKPDLIRHSKEAKDELIAAERSYKSECFATENSGAGKDTQELVKTIVKERASLKSYCQIISRIIQESDLRGAKVKGELEELTEAKERTKVSLDTTIAALEKTNRVNADLQNELQKNQSEMTKANDEKEKSENEITSVKEKCAKLQAVFRALILVMNDKKGKIDGEKGGDKKGGGPSDDSDGPTRLIDYIKGIKTKYTGLVTEKENLEEKVKSLQREVDESRTKEKQGGKSGRVPDTEGFEDEHSQTKAVLQEKERILNELLLTSARDKRRFAEKLQEIYDEFTRVKSKFGDELEKQRQTTPGSVLVLEKVYQEFVESVTHTETFIQSVVHERRVTVVADSSSDPNLELAKENEELIGRIGAIQSSRRREMKSLKEEIAKVSKEKEDAVRVTETKWKNEIGTVKKECEKMLKEKGKIVSDVKQSWKEEADQLKFEVRRVSDEYEIAQRTLRNESRLAVEKLEGKNKLLKVEMDKMVAEKKESESKMAETKRKYAAEAKEKEHLAESEISRVRTKWADAERKLRTAAEERQATSKELERVNREKGEEETKSAREIQKLRATLENTQTQSAERNDSFKRERERLQRTIGNLDESVKKTEVSGLERTQTRITEFQRTLEDLAKKNKLLENAKLNSEQSLGAELEKVRQENLKFQRESREQRRVVVNSKEQPGRIEPNLTATTAERVKVLGSAKQPPIEKPKLVSSLESVPGSLPGPPVSQRKVKVRESQTAVIRKGRVQEHGVRRTSDQRDPIYDELGAIFQQINDAPEWMDESRTPPVIQARPLQTRTQGNEHEMQPQKPQPEWETAERQDRARPISKDPPRNVPTRQQEATLPTASGKPSTQLFPQRTGYHKEDEPAKTRPPYPKATPITKQSQNFVEASGTNSSAAEKPERHPPETKRLPVENKAKSVKSRHARRPSVGSDDVFMTDSLGRVPTLTSHGSKHADFWRSQSLTDLTDASDEKDVKHSGHPHTSRKHKQKLPKSFSGPRKVESSKPDNAHTSSSLSRSGKESKARKVTPLKGMEYVLFQHQI